MEDILPFYLVAGASYEFFMQSCPKELKPYEIAFRERRKFRDYDMYAMGQYVYSAVLAAVDGALRGRKSQATYLEKPLSELSKVKRQLTGDEKVRQEKLVMNTLLDMQKRFEANKKRKEGGIPNGNRCSDRQFVDRDDG